MDQKAFVLDFLQKHHLAVVATVDSVGHPEAAVLGFAQTDSLDLIFNTSTTSLKYRNLCANPHIALVIGWEDGQTLQYEGEARELHGEEANRYKQIMVAKNPGSRKHEDEPDERHFVVTPRWIRYSDIRQEPPYVFELRFSS